MELTRLRRDLRGAVHRPRGRRRQLARAANSTGSIIWPMKPSASTTTGLRYRSARSKAKVVRSAISCTESGARTRVLVVAVAAAFDDLVVVALLGRDVAEARVRRA